jgi:hypothetical protein
MEGVHTFEAQDRDNTTRLTAMISHPTGRPAGNRWCPVFGSRRNSPGSSANMKVGAAIAAILKRECTRISPSTLPSRCETSQSARFARTERGVKKRVTLIQRTSTQYDIAEKTAAAPVTRALVCAPSGLSERTFRDDTFPHSSRALP